MRPGRVGDDAGQRRLAAAGRAEEDQRGDAVGFDGAAQQLARPQDVRLPDELVERARAHPVGQRSFFGLVARGSVLEEVGHGYWFCACSISSNAFATVSEYT